MPPQKLQNKLYACAQCCRAAQPALPGLQHTQCPLGCGVEARVLAEEHQACVVCAGLHRGLSAHQPAVAPPARAQRLRKGSSAVSTLHVKLTASAHKNSPSPPLPRNKHAASHPQPPACASRTQTAPPAPCTKCGGARSGHPGAGCQLRCARASRHRLPGRSARAACLYVSMPCCMALLAKRSFSLPPSRADGGSSVMKQLPHTIVSSWRGSQQAAVNGRHGAVALRRSQLPCSSKPRPPPWGILDASAPL